MPTAERFWDVESKCYFRRQGIKNHCLSKMCVGCGILLIPMLTGQCSVIENFRMRFACNRCVVSGKIKVNAYD